LINAIYPLKLKILCITISFLIIKWTIPQPTTKMPGRKRQKRQKKKTTGTPVGQPVEQPVGQSTQVTLSFKVLNRPCSWGFFPGNPIVRKLDNNGEEKQPYPCYSRWGAGLMSKMGYLKRHLNHCGYEARNVAFKGFMILMNPAMNQDDMTVSFNVILYYRQSPKIEQCIAYNIKTIQNGITFDLKIAGTEFKGLKIEDIPAESSCDIDYKPVGGVAIITPVLIHPQVRITYGDFIKHLTGLFKKTPSVSGTVYSGLGRIPPIPISF